MMTSSDDNRLEADRFAHWYALSREYLAGVFVGPYGYDEDVQSEVFTRIYAAFWTG